MKKRNSFGSSMFLSFCVTILGNGKKKGLVKADHLLFYNKYPYGRRMLFKALDDRLKLVRLFRTPHYLRAHWFLQKYVFTNYFSIIN